MSVESCTPDPCIQTVYDCSNDSVMINQGLKVILGVWEHELKTIANCWLGLFPLLGFDPQEIMPGRFFSGIWKIGG